VNHNFGLRLCSGQRYEALGMRPWFRKVAIVELAPSDRAILASLYAPPKL
jgi:hypothetical protein